MIPLDKVRECLFECVCYKESTHPLRHMVESMSRANKVCIDRIFACNYYGYELEQYFITTYNYVRRLSFGVITSPLRREYHHIVYSHMLYAHTGYQRTQYQIKPGSQLDEPSYLYTSFVDCLRGDMSLEMSDEIMEACSFKKLEVYIMQSIVTGEILGHVLAKIKYFESIQHS